MSAKNKAAKARSDRSRDNTDYDAEWDVEYDGKATFPNGVLRVIDHGNIKKIDGIRHVYLNGEYIPLFTDHVLIVDLEWKYFNHRWLEAPGGWAQPGTPLVEKDYGDYENTNQEALDLAMSTQRELEAQGHFAPIEIRY